MPTACPGWRGAGEGVLGGGGVGRVGAASFGWPGSGLLAELSTQPPAQNDTKHGQDTSSSKTISSKWTYSSKTNFIENHCHHQNEIDQIEQKTKQDDTQLGWHKQCMPVTLTQKSRLVPAFRPSTTFRQPFLQQWPWKFIWSPVFRGECVRKPRSFPGSSQHCRGSGFCGQLWTG